MARAAEAPRAGVDVLVGSARRPEIDDWAIIVPQLQRCDLHWEVAGRRLSVHLCRRSQSTQLVNAYSGPEDRSLAAVITGVSEVGQVSASVAELRRERCSDLLLYPIAHMKVVGKDWTPTMGFTLAFPRNRIRRQIGFVVRNPQSLDDPIVTSGGPNASIV